MYRRRTTCHCHSHILVVSLQSRNLIPNKHKKAATVSASATFRHLAVPPTPYIGGWSSSPPPAFSVMVTRRYHPDPPCPHREAAPSSSLLISSPLSSARAATGLAAVFLLLLRLVLRLPRPPR